VFIAARRCELAGLAVPLLFKEAVDQLATGVRHVT
jgi:hypothetical protein